MNSCVRCGDTPTSTTMSRFNTDIICSPCEDLERAHPMYAEAARVELEAVKGGNYNYPGIGKPSDL